MGTYKSPEKCINRMSMPNCYYLFLNDNSHWCLDGTVGWPKKPADTQKARDLLRKTFGKNIPRMRREMFIYKVNTSIPSNHHYIAAAPRADICSSYDLANDKVFEKNYARECGA